MTAPIQELPPWLSYSTSVATNPAGEPTETFTTVVNLPLTYYGPSIPLDTAWVYGGSTSPPLSSGSGPSATATAPTPTSPGSIVPTSTPATPTSLSATPSITSPSTSSRSSTSTFIPTTPPTTSSTAPSLSPPTSTSSSAISGKSSRSNRAGVIVGAVLGSLFGSLLLLFAFICILRRRQRGQRPRAHRQERPTSQVMWMWHDVRRNDDDQDADLDAQLRSPGEASAQSSGDERDAFLRRSGDAAQSTGDTAPSARLIDAPRTSRDSSGPIGVALATGSKPSIPYPGQRHIISREQLAKVSPDEADLGPESPLLAPPPVNISHGSRKSLLASERSMTPGNDPESALLYTAQRVQVGSSQSSSPGSPWAEAIGVPNILRRSWLNPRRRSGTPTSSSPMSSVVGRQLTDNELEAGRSLNSQLRSEMGYRDGARPISGVSAFSAVSARSGNTLFYDAQSREDLSSPLPPPVPPLPQGIASTSRGGPAGPSPLSAEPFRASEESEQLPAYQPETSDDRDPDDAVDYLDVPIPRPASPFASVSSTARLSPPPGLDVPHSNLAPAPSPDVSNAIHVELLEEEPPAAGESWRQISLGLPARHERRTTFGLAPSTVVYPREQSVSEQGSLRSMRSHLGAHSPLSASGSAPTSNSNSQHSRGVTASSLKSLAHSSSISSTDRRLIRRSPGEVSPPLSATGRRSSVSPPSRGIREPSPVPPALVAAAAPQLVQNTTMTSTATRSSVTTHTSMTDPITGEVVRFPHPAWTGGRDDLTEEPDVRPSSPPSAWGGSWSSPGHLRALQNRVAERGGHASHA